MGTGPGFVQRRHEGRGPDRTPAPRWPATPSAPNAVHARCARALSTRSAVIRIGISTEAT